MSGTNDWQTASARRAAAGAAHQAAVGRERAALQGNRLSLRPADAAPQAGGPGHVRVRVAHPAQHHGRGVGGRLQGVRVADRRRGWRCAVGAASAHRRSGVRLEGDYGTSRCPVDVHPSAHRDGLRRVPGDQTPATSSKTTTRITAASIRSTSMGPSPSSTRASWSPGPAPSATSWTVARSRPVRSASSTPTASPTASRSPWSASAKPTATIRGTRCASARAPASPTGSWATRADAWPAASRFANASSG